MAGSEPHIEWYLARDGVQHGPLSIAEMRVFIDFGHWRPNDLVWRAGYADWQPVSQAVAEFAAGSALEAAPHSTETVEAAHTGQRPAQDHAGGEQPRAPADDTPYSEQQVTPGNEAPGAGHEAAPAAQPAAATGLTARIEAAAANPPASEPAVTEPHTAGSHNASWAGTASETVAATAAAGAATSAGQSAAAYARQPRFTEAAPPFGEWPAQAGDRRPGAGQSTGQGAGQDASAGASPGAGAGPARGQSQGQARPSQGHESAPIGPAAFNPWLENQVPEAQRPAGAAGANTRQNDYLQHNPWLEIAPGAPGSTAAADARSQNTRIDGLRLDGPREPAAPSKQAVRPARPAASRPDSQAPAAVRRPAAQPQSQPQPQLQLQPHLQPRPREQSRQPARDQVTKPDPRADRDGDGVRPRRGIVRAAAIVAGVLILSGSGWIAWQNRSALTGMSALGGVMLAQVSTAGGTSEAYQTSPFVAMGETRDEIDQALQKTAIWRVLKRDNADWYAERLVDVERMRAQKTDEKTISKFLADVVVVLRRKSASHALAASQEHMKQVASSFLDNLRTLASRDAKSCFGFISYGEATLFMLELTRSPTFAEPMQHQLVAVFEAIADGNKSPTFYAATRRADYDVLTAELTARGWTQEDLVTFSDSRRLSSSPPDKVCQMVQDWFTVQLALKDPELQGRLLAESLRPLVQN